jgi:hypothetical protein
MFLVKDRGLFLFLSDDPRTQGGPEPIEEDVTFEEDVSIYDLHNGHESHENAMVGKSPDGKVYRRFRSSKEAVNAGFTFFAMTSQCICYLSWEQYIAGR